LEILKGLVLIRGEEREEEEKKKKKAMDIDAN
jgi:hypothetical protein